MLPDLESLRCFDAAAGLLNFRRAAKQVALSPNAFSDRVAGLEEQLGVALFRRTTRKVELTAAGERLLPHVRGLLAQAAACVPLARDEGQVPPYELLVGTRYELGLSWLVPSLDLLRASHPERTVHLRFGDGPDLLERLRGGEIDCVVTSSRLSQRALAWELLHEERYVFVAAPRLQRSSQLRRPEDAERCVLLDLDRDLPLFRYFADARGRQEVWRFQRHEYLGTIAAVRARALAGAGVAVLPRYFVERELRARTLVALLPGTRPLADHFRLVWRAGHRREPELRGLAAELGRLPLR